MGTEDAEFFLAQAARCRTVAGEVPNQNDPVVDLMLKIAVDFEAQVAAYERRRWWPTRSL
jgi:hypothetical protein